jgi:galactarate dehydratase (D-threo-forming)
MKIAEVRVYPPIRVKRKYPTVVSMQVHKDGIKPVEASDFVLFEVIADNGLRGTGEVSDIPDESPLDMARLKADLERALLGRSPYDVSDIVENLEMPSFEQRHVIFRVYHCAVDMALHDLQAKAASEPLYRLLGGKRRAQLDINAVIYMRDPKLVGEEVRERLGQGFRDFKLKMGLGFDHDEACMATVREAAGPKSRIRIDPNGAWTVEQSIQFLRKIEKYGVDGVETPIPAKDIDGKVAIKRAVKIPILEHVSDPDFALACVRTGAVDVFNIALVSCGAFDRMVRVAAVAEAAGIPCLIGSTLELGPGTAAQAHFGAAALTIGSYPNDLVGPLMYQHDVIRRPWSYTQGSLALGDGPGLGVELDYDRLGKPI